MVVWYLFSALVGGFLAAGFGVVQGFPWYSVIALYSAGGTMVTVMAAILASLVLPILSTFVARDDRKQATPFAAPGQRQPNHGRNPISL